MQLQDDVIHSPESFGSEYCQRAAGFLVCQSSFPLCDCENGYSYFASEEVCESLSNFECWEEWTTARQYRISLPNCTNLPKEEMSEDELCNAFCCDKYTLYSQLLSFVKCLQLQDALSMCSN